jgi:hypothetical protein
VHLTQYCEAERGATKELPPASWACRIGTRAKRRQARCQGGNVHTTQAKSHRKSKVSREPESHRKSKVSCGERPKSIISGRHMYRPRQLGTIAPTITHNSHNTIATLGGEGGGQNVQRHESSRRLKHIQRGSSGAV